MAPVYKVWLHIERVDEATDTYEDIDCLDFASTATFPTLAEAEAFTRQLHAEHMLDVTTEPTDGD